MMIVLCECGQVVDDWREKECRACRGEKDETPEVVSAKSTPQRLDVEWLACALHAEDHQADIKRVADRREGETERKAEGRAWAIMWQRETEAERERYRVRAVGLLAWMGRGGT